MSVLLESYLRVRDIIIDNNSTSTSEFKSKQTRRADKEDKCLFPKNTLVSLVTFQSSDVEYLLFLGISTLTIFMGVGDNLSSNQK